MKSRSATPTRLPDFVEPMKAKLVDSMPVGDWIYEVKFDGYRALALRGGGDETRVLSRNQKDLGGKFPEVKDSIAALDIQDAIVDGEIVALDEKGRSSFQLLQGIDMGEQRPPIVFYAFDLLQLNGKDLQTKVTSVLDRPFPLGKNTGITLLPSEARKTSAAATGQAITVRVVPSRRSNHQPCLNRILVRPRPTERRSPP